MLEKRRGGEGSPSNNVSKCNEDTGCQTGKSERVSDEKWRQEGDTIPDFPSNKDLLLFNHHSTGKQ